MAGLRSSAGALAATLLLVTLAVRSANSAEGTCRELSNPNLFCLKEAIQVEANCNFNMYIYEDCPVGSILFTVEGGGAVLSDCDGLLHTPDGSSTVSLAQVLDAEASVKQKCTDLVSGGDFDNMLAMVFFVDVNEMTPKIVNAEPFESLSVFERNDPGAVLKEFGFYDPDLDETASLTFVTNLEDEGWSAELSVDQVGDCPGKDDKCWYQLTATQSLDYERRMFYDIYMTFTSGDSRGNTSSSDYQLWLRLKDVADTEPVWTVPVPSKSMLENNNTVSVYTVQAIDGDSEINNDINYSITGGNEAGLFTVNLTSGAVWTTGPVDRDTLDNPIFSIVIMALEVTIDGIPAPLPNNISQVTMVQVLDVNDMWPTFDVGNVSMTKEIDELINADVKLGVIYVTDMDENNAGWFTVTSNDPRHLEVSPSSGRGAASFTLTALYKDDDNIFDADSAAAGGGSVGPLVFTITATEEEDQRHTSTVTITVHLKDVNDIAPVFGPPACATNLPETVAAGTAVCTLSATDSDVTPDFGTAGIRYYLPSSCDYFVVDEESGEVTVAEDVNFDFETNHQLTCKAEARDSEGGEHYNSGFTNVTVTLIDINDTPPDLSAESYTLSVFENATNGTTVAVVTAIDADSGAAIIFSLNYATDTLPAVTGWFNVVPVGGRGGTFQAEVRVAAPLDREALDPPAVVSVTVLAEDTETMSGTRTSTVQLTITVMDVNDEPPTWCKDCTLGLTVDENSPEGTPVASVTASDPDDADQGRLVFSCSDNNDKLTISEDGLLTVKEAADINREVEDNIDIVLTVTDTAGRAVSIDVVVQVLDINDETPVLDMAVCGGDYSVSEWAEDGDYVATITATDADLQGTPHSSLTYKLQNLLLTAGNNPITPFAVDLVTGFVTVNLTDEKVLDYRAETKWQLRLRVYDACFDMEPYCSPRMAECEMTVLVDDENNLSPEALGDFSVTTGEALPANTEVPNSKIMAIDEDKVNTDASAILYEVVAFRLLGSDQDLEAPFVADNHHLENSQFITEWYCTLSTSRKLANLAGDYSLIVKATDQEEPFHETNITVAVTITDANDNAPVVIMWGCLADDQTVIMEEEVLQPGQVIPCMDGVGPAELRFSDADKDSPNNIVVLDIDYELSTVVKPGTVEPNQLDSFDLSRQGMSYFLYLKADADPINFEQGYSYNLTIRAVDGGNPPLESFDWILVNVNPVDEYPPNFCEDLVDCVATMWIEEENSNAAGSFREADDEDNWQDSDNYQIYYHLVGGDDAYFQIPDALVAEIQPAELLDREHRDEYTVLVNATNSRQAPPRIELEDVTTTDVIVITVVVVDVNDNAPQFLHPVVFGSVVQDGTGGQVVALLQAYDKDLNESLSYAFNGEFVWVPPASYGDVFQIDSLEDNITAKVIVPRDPSSLTGYCIFPVKVQDKLASGEHFDEVTVQVFVVTITYQVPFYFKNDIEALQQNEDEITNILTDVFGYIASIDAMTLTSSGSGGGDNTTQDSVVTAHFVNVSGVIKARADDQPPGTLVLSSVITTAASSGRISFELESRFTELGLDLYSVGVSRVKDSKDFEAQVLLLQVLLGATAMLLGSMLFLMLAAYILRTRKLERHIKVLSSNTFGSQASGVNRAGLSAVPTSNLFTGDGANPIWNIAEDKYPHLRSGSMSSGSGDSVLVGVEDNPEFRDYKGVTSAPLEGQTLSGDAAGALQSNGPFYGAGGRTSNNPLLAGVDMTSTEVQERVQQQDVGDLGVANTAYSFF